MESDHQKEILSAMQRPDFYPHPVEAVSLQETHISRVLLTGTYVYKIKKPVDLDFLDFSTLEKRRHFCRMEVDLNRRLTHDIYEGVVSIKAKDRCYYLEGPGDTVEYAVKMKQLPEKSSMARLLPEGKMDTRSIDQLAQEEIEQGNSVILDATFSRKNLRREALRLAEDMDANIVFIECRCREAVIRERLGKRSKSPAISDARLKHLEEFKCRYEAPDEIPADFKTLVDTEKPLAENIEKILSA